MWPVWLLRYDQCYDFCFVWYLVFVCIILFLIIYYSFKDKHYRYICAILREKNYLQKIAMIYLWCSYFRILTLRVQYLTLRWHISKKKVGNILFLYVFLKVPTFNIHMYIVEKIRILVIILILMLCLTIIFKF